MLKYILIGFGILLLGIVAVFVFQFPPQINEEMIASSVSIQYSSENNFRQSINDCGPFNVAAVARALKQEPVSSAEFADSMEWRLKNKYTLPWGLEKQLKEHRINIETPHLGKLSDEDKIKYLKEQLSLKKPIILLGEQEGYQHYITLLGFDSDNFYVYNSLMDKGEQEGMTVDKNGENPGNMDMTIEELMDFWSSGGMYGVYNWYAIINS